jgi:hypothetical protein
VRDIAEMKLLHYEKGANYIARVETRVEFDFWVEWGNADRIPFGRRATVFRGLDRFESDHARGVSYSKFWIGSRGIGRPAIFIVENPRG